MYTLKNIKPNTCLKILSIMLLSTILYLPAQAESQSTPTPKNKPQQKDIMPVIGQYLDNTLEGLSASATNFSGEDLKTSGSVYIKNLLNQTPNVTIGEGWTSFRIRGIANNGGPLTKPAYAPTLINGVPISSYALTNFKASTWDAQSVTILKGAQPTVLGINALAGALLIDYNEPDFTPHGAVKGVLGQHDTKQVFGTYNLPLVKDRLALRLSFEHEYGKGAESYPNLDKAPAKTDQNVARAVLLFRPTGQDDLKFTLSHINVDSKTGRYAIVDDLKHKIVDTRYKDDYSGTVNITGLKAEKVFANGSKLESITGYNRVDANTFYDWMQSPKIIQWSNRNVELDVFTQELKYAFTLASQPFDIGVFYRKNDLHEYGTYLYGKKILSWTNMDRSSSYAVFGNGQFNLTNRFTFFAGLRYSYDDIDYGPKNSKGTGSTSLLSPSLVLNYKFREGADAGLSMKRGYQSGGVSIALTEKGPDKKIYKPEYTMDYEGYLRLNVLGGRLQFDTNLFYIDWKDKQETGRINGLRHTVNAGSGRMYGLELSTKYAVNTDLQTSFSLGLLDTKFTSGPKKGKEFSYTPRVTASAGFIYDTGSFYTSSTLSYIGSTKDTTYKAKNKSVFLLEARAGYRFAKRFELFIQGSNLLDQARVIRRIKRDGAYADQGTDVVLGQARTITGGLKVTF